MSKSRDEMKKWLQAWAASKVYKEFKEKKDLMKQRSLNKQELIALCNSIIELNNLPYEEKMEFELFEEIAICSSRKIELYKELVKNLSIWYQYLYKYLLKEEYEMCALLRDVIQIEKNDFYLLLAKYCQEFEVHADTESIKMVDNQIKQLFGI